ncbi:YjjG family noncanonical pyrimidine nucleotidase [Ascidiimonas aurantiaca]|uniref:YjjG family noncanonical pyrimidine nucleotidase n=1 Tax=Ascidiimonas aurantiaca TaxID=1685432 RepID=UPI0030EF9CC1
MKDKVTDIFFDLDHTLWDFEKNSQKAFESIFDDFNVNLSISDFLEIYSPLNFKYWKLYREEKISKELLRYKRLKDTFEALDFQAEDDFIYWLSDIYIKRLPQANHLLENAKTVLQYLKPRYTLHIITNGFEEIQEVKLRNTHIREFFSKVVNSEMAGVKKPNPFIFELALSKANVPPERSVMIGDNLEADILGARNVGMHTIHLNSNKEPLHAHGVIINDLIEIKQYL